MQGRVLFGEQAEPPRQYAFGARDRCDETAFRLRTVRDKRYRYIRNFTPDRPLLQANEYKQRQYPVWSLLPQLAAQGKLTPAQAALTAPTMPPEEVYDLDRDQNEIDNLVNSSKPAHRAALKRLQAELNKWIETTNDEGRIPEPPEVAAAKGATKPGGNPNAEAIRKPDEANPGNSPGARVSIRDGKWYLNGAVTYPGAKAEGLLMNVRMVNAVFEDANDTTRPKGFDPDANTDAFIKQIPDYVAGGVRAFTISLQGGMPGYEGALNSAFNPDGSLRDAYLKRVRRVIEACDKHGAVVILGCYYQRQDQVLKDEGAVRAGVVNAAKWIKDSGFTNVVLEIANEFAHAGFDHALLKSSRGEAELIALAKKTAPELLVSTSGMGSGTLPDEAANAADFLLIHFNTTQPDKYPGLIAGLKKYGKPIVCNEDDKVGEEGAKAAELCVTGGAS
ncbi:MAG: hypothetical protein ACREVR_16880, partial [Burkholderiales bacterium]